MAPQSCSRNRASKELSQPQRVQRLQESRIKFSSIARSKADAFRQTRAKVTERELFQQQVKEMHEVEDRLKRLRLEYDKVCRERGKAHQSALLVRLQEQEIAEFERRRNQMVQQRAEKVARKEAAIHHKKLTDQSRKKQEQLEKRKAVFETDWTPTQASSDPLKWKDKKTFARELENLIALEKTIDQNVRAKRLRQLQQQQQQKASKNLANTAPASNCCQRRGGPAAPPSCSGSSSCSCSGSSTPVSEVGSVICVEEIARRVYLKLEGLKHRNEAQQRQHLQQQQQQKCTVTTKAAAGDRAQQRNVREAGVNTSRLVNNGQENDPQHLILSSSPSTSYRSIPDDMLYNRHFQELVRQLNDVSAIQSPDEAEEENASSFSSERTITKNVSTRPKRVVSPFRSESNQSSPQRSMRREVDLSCGSIDSLPHFPSFDRSYFWKDVFNTAGVSMSETIARVLRDAKRTSENIEKSLSLLSISEAECINSAKDN